VRLSRPRVTPIDEAEVEGEAKELLEIVRQDGQVARIYKTLIRHPKLFKRWRIFGNHVLNKSSLPAREREILILRIGWLCKAEYEFSAHIRIGKSVGLTDEEIARIQEGPDAPGWSRFEAALLRAVDELRGDAFIRDGTWEILSERFDTPQLLDVIFAVGQYNLLAMALNSLGVQPEVPVEGFPR
jgi:4-carboxymuconolactone decarboxylase